MEKSRYIKERDARCKLLNIYFKSVGAAQLRDAQKIFQWKVDHTKETLKLLITKKEIINVTKINSEHEEWFSIPELVDAN